MYIRVELVWIEYGLHLVQQRGSLSPPKELFGSDVSYIAEYHCLRILSSEALTAASYKTKLVSRSPENTQITSSRRFIPRINSIERFAHFLTVSTIRRFLFSPANKIFPHKVGSFAAGYPIASAAFAGPNSKLFPRTNLNAFIGFYLFYTAGYVFENFTNTRCFHTNTNLSTNFQSAMFWKSDKSVLNRNLIDERRENSKSAAVLLRACLHSA